MLGSRELYTVKLKQTNKKNIYFVKFQSLKDGEIGPEFLNLSFAFLEMPLYPSNAIFLQIYVHFLHIRYNWLKDI